jgi:hypothetical protein
MAPDPAAWQAMWKPYWMANGRIPDWLPLVAGSGTLYDI